MYSTVVSACGAELVQYSECVYASVRMLQLLVVFREVQCSGRTKVQGIVSCGSITKTALLVQNILLSTYSRKQLVQ
jgi:hypothetical protein